MKNINEEISLVNQSEKQSSFDPFIRGYHAYLEIWASNGGDDSSLLKCENGKEHNKYAVTVIVGGRTGGHFQ